MFDACSPMDQTNGRHAQLYLATTAALSKYILGSPEGGSQKKKVFLVEETRLTRHQKF